MKFGIGDKVKLDREYGNPVLLELTQYPSKASVNGISGEDELLVVGYILRKDSTYDGRIHKAKPFIIHKDRITKL
ncbi:hypothetical protein [Bacillus phage Nachito]|nr:hypothetical protein [Bacillus phage Nachito]